MMRTTISRSRVVLLAAAALMAWSLAGQDTTQVPQQAPERPTRHVVRAGETLWSLAQLYLGDPLLWPEIYRLNTLVVEDPHWIYPGEELLLAQADQTAAPIDVAEQPMPVDTVAPPPVQPVVTPDSAEQGQQRPQEDVPPPVEAADAPELAPPPPPPPAQMQAPTVFARRGGAANATLTTGVSATFPYRAVRRGDFYAAGFLTENEDLPWARVVGPVERTRGIPRLGAASATQFEEILLEAPEGATYHVGDSLLIARRGPGVRGWGRIVIPAGIVRVIAVAGREVQAEVVSQFDRISDGLVAIPVEPFRDPGTARPVPVEQGLDAEVLALRDGNILAPQTAVLFVNRGRSDGIVPGDQFELLRPTDPNLPEGAPPQPLGVLQIVHVRDGSATGMMLEVYGAGIRPGVPARLIRKMPG